MQIRRTFYLGDLNCKELKACDVYSQSIDRFPPGATDAYQQSVSVRLVDDTGNSSHVFNSTLEKYEGQRLMSIVDIYYQKQRIFLLYDSKSPGEYCQCLLSKTENILII
jgi:hypothetical protein